MHVPEDEDYRQTLADRAAARRAAAAEPREEVAWVEDLDASGVHARLYIPAGADDRQPYARGLIVHLHGGGFVFNDVEVHDPAARRLANRTGRSVLSVDYRLAPEHPYPAAVHDVDHALAWAASQTPYVMVHGDSAGANLGLVGALRNPGLVKALSLTYPFIDPTSSHASYTMTDMTWDRDEAQWYWNQYLADPADRAAADVAPMNSDRLGTLPPTMVLTAENDIARDEGERLVGVLRLAGVEAFGMRMLGVPHGFWRNQEFAAQSHLAMAHSASFFDSVLDSEELTRR